MLAKVAHADLLHDLIVQYVVQLLPRLWPSGSSVGKQMSGAVSSAEAAPQDRRNTPRLRKFKQMLKAALSELERVGAITTSRVDENDMGFVDRFPSIAQQRLLAAR
jgi:hypothetical protein